MGSHYIPVSGITIDTIKDAIADALPDLIDLDILCPAAGYDTTPPDPAIYCPANGYFPDDSWVPPVETVNPDGSGGQQILLLCDDTGAGLLSVNFTVNTGSRKWEILSVDMSVITSGVVAGTSSIVITFPTQGTGALYLVRLSPDTAGGEIRTYQTNNYTGYSSYDFRIIQAKFYTPNLTGLSLAFASLIAFRECIFLTNMNQLTTMASCFTGSGVVNISFPSEMNACTTMSNMCQNTLNLKRLDLSGTSLNLLQTVTGLAYRSAVSEIKLPSSLPACTTIQNLAYECRNLRKIVWPLSAPLLQNISNACYGCNVLQGIQKLPPLPGMTNAGSIFQDCQMVSKVEFQGPSDLCTNYSSVIRGCLTCEELIMPSSMNAMTNTWGYFAYQAPLKKITIPESMSSITTGASYAWSDSGLSSILEEITTCNNWGSSLQAISILSHRLIAFHQPSLKVAGLVIGFSATLKAKLTQIEIDWAGSDANITIRAELPTAEINRIFTALPYVSGRTFDGRYNPGYADCDKTIATAKGWIVL